MRSLLLCILNICLVAGKLHAYNFMFMGSFIVLSQYVDLRPLRHALEKMEKESSIARILVIFLLK